MELFLGVLADADLAAEDVVGIGTIDKLAGHPAVLAVAAATDCEVTGYAPETLDAVAVPTPSDYVRDAMRTRSVAEAAALLGAGPGGRLVLPKQIGGGVITVAVAVGRQRTAAGVQPS